MLKSNLLLYYVLSELNSIFVPDDDQLCFQTGPFGRAKPNDWRKIFPQWASESSPRIFTGVSAQTRPMVSEKNCAIIGQFTIIHPPFTIGALLNCAYNHWVMEKLVLSKFTERRKSSKKTQFHGSDTHARLLTHPGMRSLQSISFEKRHYFLFNEWCYKLPYYLAPCEWYVFL